MMKAIPVAQNNVSGSGHAQLVWRDDTESELLRLTNVRARVSQRSGNPVHGGVCLLQGVLALQQVA